MKVVEDPIGVPQSPDRVSYALGTLLGVEDFVAEQSYHRGRLARALGALHGGGTIAGLRVDYKPAGANQAEELQVTPGLALDRFGRLIEVPRTWCIRLAKWYNEDNADRAAKLKAAFRGAPRNAVVLDIFIRFQPCPRGLTPSFASTTFDGINAVSTARVRDGFAIDLIPRKTLTTPDVQWPGIAQGASKAAIQKAILDAGKELGVDYEKGAWKPQAEHEPGIDTTSLLLARFDVPAVDANPKPARTGQPQQPDNSIRRFIYPPSLLAQLQGL